MARCLTATFLGSYTAHYAYKYLQLCSCNFAASYCWGKTLFQNRYAHIGLHVVLDISEWYTPEYTNIAISNKFEISWTRRSGPKAMLTVTGRLENWLNWVIAWLTMWPAAPTMTAAAAAILLQSTRTRIIYEGTSNSSCWCNLIPASYFIYHTSK